MNGKTMKIKAKKKILIPLDSSETSLLALAPAKGLAKLLGMALHALYISDEELTKDELIKKVGLHDEDLPKIMLNHKSGCIEDVILEESKTADFVIMSSHGETCNKEKLAGSTTIKIMENIDVPLIIIKPEIVVSLEEGFWKPKKILIPLNGSMGAAQALAPVMNIISKIQSHIDLLHISSSVSCQETETAREEGTFTAPYYQDYQHHEWKLWEKEFMRRFYEIMRENNVKTTLKLTHSTGEPAEEIIKFALENDIDFIALAWHGNMGHLHAVTMQKVLSKTPCPILLVKIK